MEFVCKLNTFVNKILYIFEPISLFNIMQYTAKPVNAVHKILHHSYIDDWHNNSWVEIILIANEIRDAHCLQICTTHTFNIKSEIYE